MPLQPRFKIGCVLTVRAVLVTSLCRPALADTSKHNYLAESMLSVAAVLRLIDHSGVVCFPAKSVK